MLRVDIHLDTGFRASLAFQFNLCGDGILTGGADLQTSGDLSLDFDFGIDLDNPTDVYLFDSTQFSGNLAANANDLTFRAALGPLGVFVDDGSATIGAASVIL